MRWIIWGGFRAPAAHEAGHLVEAALFGAAVDEAVTAGAEIAEVVWVDPLAPGDLVLAPLTRDVVLPMLRFGPAASP